MLIVLTNTCFEANRFSLDVFVSVAERFCAVFLYRLVLHDASLTDGFHKKYTLSPVLVADVADTLNKPSSFHQTPEICDKIYTYKTKT